MPPSSLRAVALSMASDSGEAFVEKTLEAQKQYDEVATKYRGTPQWMKAPNGKPTNLTERQWVQVRTPNFKKWFGDWETAAIIQEIENMPAKDVKPHEALDKAGIKDVFRSFGEVENKRDGRTVVFPSASAGKIKYHKGFNSSSIIRSFKTLFESAIPAFSEKEILKDGHKQHRSYESYEHYVNKFTINGNEYFIRFTVPVIKNNPNSDNVHSTAVSEVAVYQNERASTVVSAFNNAESNVGISGKGGSSQFIDGKLANFLNSVKPESVSKVVDENGEPLVVYHGSAAMFNEFKSKFIGHSTGTADGRGFYFTTDKSYAEGFKSKDGRVIEAFLNIRDTLDYKKKTIGKSALKKIIKEIDRAEFEADGEHYFISNFGNYYDKGIDKVIDEATESNYDFCDTDVEIFNVLVTSGADFDLTAKAIKNVTGKDGEIVPKDNNTTHFITFNSNQAKSATDNTGAFDKTNPNIKWKDDTVLMPIDINVFIARNIDALMNAIRKSHKSVLAKKAELEKKYPDDDKDSRHGKITELRDFILDNFSSELVPIAKLSDEDFKFYRKQFGIRDRFVYTSFGYAIEHYFNRHPNTPIENYLLLPDTIINPDKKKEVGKWIKDELGEWIYDASQAFVKEYDKWHVSTIKVDSQLTQSGKKLIAFKNFYGARKEPYGNKKTIEDYWKNATSSSKVIRRQAKISTLNNFNRQDESSIDGIENQENNSQLRFLLRQDRTENPVIWASIVLSKEILNGRGITRAKLEKVLPSERFDGSKQNYAIDRAKRIAEKTRLTQGGFAEDLDRAIRKAESDLFWQEEFVENAYRAFSRGGEEYGFAKAKIMQYLKDLKNRELNKVKGYESGDFETDYVKSIAVAMENEPERRKQEDDSAGLEEELEAAEGDFSDEAEIPARPALEHSPVRDIIRNVRMEVTRRVRASDGDENTRREKYRKTLVNILTDAAAELSYGRERELIMGKITELSQKKYAVIRIKDGERAGETTDNFTLRAENIALRIFNRGVRDTKAALLEKFDRALKNAKAPKRVERDDKRKMTGKAELRAKSIKDIAAMSSEDVDAAVEAAMNAINKADSAEANDFHEKLIDAVQRLEDLQRFGALRDKSRADMAEALEWVEKFLESETKAQAERVERLKADAEARRKVFIDAVNEMERNANFDSKARKAARLVFNSASTFKDLVLGLGRAASGEKYRKFRALADKMADDYYAATTRKENEVFRLQEEFSRAVEEIYGMNAPEAFRHLLGRSDRLQKYSVQGKPMSVQIALQRLSMAEQESYRHNVYIHCAAKSAEAKSLEDRIAKLEQKLAEGDMDGAQYRADREALDGLRKELSAEENRAVEAYAQKLRSELSEADLRLLDWLRNFYRRERDSLSEANEAVTGLGIPQADPLYTPMKMLREGGTNERVQIVAIVPKSLSPRVPNSLDMDESVGIVDMWQNRVSENAHYKAFSQLNIEWRGVFAHADFHRAVSSKLGENVLNQLLDHFNDIMSVRLLSGLKIEALDKLNGLYAISALGFNLGSGLRQMTGVSAFVNFIGAAECLKYAREALSKDGRRAAIEILNSETGKRRMARGNNQALVEALNNVEDNKFWAWYKRNSMVFNRWGDILPIMTIGQGIYRAKTAEYAKTMPLEKAKERAMAEMWAIAEASQQSPSVMNLGTWQRRGGSFGKSAGLFISSPQLMLSREIAVFNRFNEMRKKYSESPADAEIRADYMAARKEFAKTVFVNHVLVQGGYMMATLLWKAALGDDWDEDDAWAMLAETIAGPLGGLIVFGRFVSAFYSNMGVSAMPIEGFGRTIKSGVDLLQDIMVLDGESVKKDLDKLGRSLFAPYRDVSKAVIYYTATIALNNQQVAKLHPELTDKSCKIFYWTTNNSGTGTNGCYGQKKQLTNFNSSIGAINSGHGTLAVWIHPSISSTETRTVPVYTGPNQYTMKSVVWGDYIREIFSDPENTFVAWRQTTTQGEMYNNERVWRPQRIEWIGDRYENK